jgi:hypothetical protein
VRAVTHLDISDEDIDTALTVIPEALRFGSVRAS